MMEPTERYKVVGVGGPALRPGLDMVGFQPVSGFTAFDDAAEISGENVAFQRRRNGPGAPSQAQGRAILGDPDHPNDGIAGYGL